MIEDLEADRLNAKTKPLFLTQIQIQFSINLRGGSSLPADSIEGSVYLVTGLSRIRTVAY